MLNGFYRIAFQLYGSIEELQAGLDRWLEAFNRNRPHQGRWCFGKTVMQTFLDAKSIAKIKSKLLQLSQISQPAGRYAQTA